MVRGGIGIFYDDINLNVATFSQLQDRIISRFGPDGLQVNGSPERQRFEFTGAKLHIPRSVNWNIQLDREWLKNLFVRVGYQQRQARREFVLNPIDSGSHGTILGLDNSGSSRYRELEVTARYKFRENDEFTAPARKLALSGSSSTARRISLRASSKRPNWAAELAAPVRISGLLDSRARARWK